MLTYQDLLDIQDTDEARMDFVRKAINQHKSSDLYKTALIANEYNAHRNVTIIRYQKLLYTMSGQTVPDVFSSNFKIPSKFFKRFITQEVQYLLGNGITFENDSTKEKLGDNWTRTEVENVIDTIKEIGMMDKSTIISFSYEMLGWAKTYCPLIRLGYITNLDTVWTRSLRHAEIFKSGKNQVFIDCRKEVVNPEDANYTTGYQEAPNKGIGLECWTVYANPQLVFDYVDKLVKGFTTAQYKFDDYMNEKWGINS